MLNSPPKRGDDNQPGWFLEKLPLDDFQLMVLFYWFIKAQSFQLSAKLFMWSLVFLHSPWLIKRHLSFASSSSYYSPQQYGLGLERINHIPVNQWVYTPPILFLMFYHCSCTKMEVMPSSALASVLKWGKIHRVPQKSSNGYPSFPRIVFYVSVCCMRKYLWVSDLWVTGSTDAAAKKDVQGHDDSSRSQGTCAWVCTLAELCWENEASST